jgi:uncharacterized protein (DUF362 family)
MVCAGSIVRPRPARAAATAGLAAVEGSAVDAARRAVELLGGMGRFVHSGQKVVVKPNIGWDRTPEQAANTNPDVVAAVVRMCLEVGAGEVLVFDRTCNDPRLSYRRSGIKDAVEAVRDRIRADVFINVPVAKHHSLSGLTLGMKNVMGVIGGNRGQIHSGFDDKIVDLNLARPSTLTVLDASRILVAHGPQGGRLEDVRKPGVVVAGPDIVAVDAYATRFFGLKPKEIDHIRRAAERGLGTMDLDKVRLREESL